MPVQVLYNAEQLGIAKHARVRPIATSGIAGCRSVDELSIVHTPRTEGLIPSIDEVGDVIHISSAFERFRLA
jgi:hypothetical protein